MPSIGRMIFHHERSQSQYFLKCEKANLVVKFQRTLRILARVEERIGRMREKKRARFCNCAPWRRTLLAFPWKWAFHKFENYTTYFSWKNCSSPSRSFSLSLSLSLDSRDFSRKFKIESAPFKLLFEWLKDRYFIIKHIGKHPSSKQE